MRATTQPLTADAMRDLTGPLRRFAGCTHAPTSAWQHNPCSA